MHKALAILKRDILENLSYPGSFFFQFTMIFSNCLVFYFIAQLFETPGGFISPFLQEYGGKYFPFVLIGLALAGSQATGLNSFSNAITKEIETGTLEAILCSPTPLESLFYFGSLWSFIVTSIHIAVYLTLGFIFFGMDMARANFPAVIASILLTVSSLAGLGVFSAGFILVFKKGDPVGFFFGTLGRFFSGVYFPVAILPLWLHGLASISPLTYSLDALRKAVLLGQGIPQIEYELRTLALFTIMLLPTGIYFFRWALDRARKDGSLVTV